MNRRWQVTCLHRVRHCHTQEGDYVRRPADSSTMVREPRRLLRQATQREQVEAAQEVDQVPEICPFMVMP